MHHHFLVFLTRFVLCLRMQARNIFIIVLVGVFHAFLLLPIALATFGDDPVAGAAHSGVQIKQVQLGVDKPRCTGHGSHLLDGGPVVRWPRPCEIRARGAAQRVAR